jgi:hypothetical protein
MKSVFLFFALIVPVTLMFASSIIVLIKIAFSKIKKLWS